MELMKDFFPNVRLPIIALIVLYYLQIVLVWLVDSFTEIQLGTDLSIAVLTAISLTFTICGWIVIAWAGLRTTKATGGGPVDGAFGGAMAAVIAGLFVRIIALLFSISSLPVLIAYSPIGPAGGFAGGIMGIFFGIVAVVLGFFIDIIFGAILGFFGAMVHKAGPQIFEGYGAATAKITEAKIVKKKEPRKKQNLQKK